MSLAWQEWQEDLLRREPQHEHKPVCQPPRWTAWDWFIGMFALCSIVGMLIIWIGDYTA